MGGVQVCGDVHKRGEHVGAAEVCGCSGVGCTGTLGGQVWGAQLCGVFRRGMHSYRVVRCGVLSCVRCSAVSGAQP